MYTAHPARLQRGVPEAQDILAPQHTARGGVLHVPAVAGGDLPVHVVGLAVRAAARRGAGGAGRGGRAAPGARRGARPGLPALAAEGQGPPAAPVPA